jgi:hypothetical protein
LKTIEGTEDMMFLNTQFETMAERNRISTTRNALPNGLATGFQDFHSPYYYFYLHKHLRKQKKQLRARQEEV